MILTLIFIVLLFCLISLFFVQSNNLIFIRSIALLGSGISLILSIFSLKYFYLNIYYFQNVITYKLGFDFFNLYFLIGLDGISIFFFILSSFLIFLCVLFVWDEIMLKEYMIALLSLDLLLLLVFSILDTLLFYIFFEAILIPMYVMIGLWGSRERKIRAVYLFFFHFNGFFMHAFSFIVPLCNIWNS